MIEILIKILVLLVLVSAVALLADKKGRIDVSIAILLILTAVNVVSFFGIRNNGLALLVIITVYIALYAGMKALLRRKKDEKKK